MDRFDQKLERVDEPTPTRRLGLAFEYQLTAPNHALFCELVVARDLLHVRATRWNTAAALDEVLAFATRSGRLGWGESALLDLDGEVDCLALVALDDGVLWVYLAANTIAALDAGEAFLRERLPVLTASEDQKVPVTFWSYGSSGAQSSTRAIAVPTWADVRGNYPERVARELDAVLDPAFRPGAAGRLLLWYGAPGTGKTYALRALAWEWRDWCTFSYVVDPETFFGQRTDYMLEVLLDANDDEERWQLLVLEDTGDLLGVDARSQTGQGLSRFLNVVDGMIGQGLRVLVLVTTNDELRRLHPAVSRPGRCLAQVEFAPFTQDEAARWLQRNGVDQEAQAGTLAALYGRADGTALPERPPIGFTTRR